MKLTLVEIDASLVKNHKLTQKEEKIVQMQNGCICCTLRADLLEEIANLAEQKEFEYIMRLVRDGGAVLSSSSYLIIESSGISEPIQVCQDLLQPATAALTHPQGRRDFHFAIRRLPRRLNSRGYRTVSSRRSDSICRGANSTRQTDSRRWSQQDCPAGHLCLGRRLYSIHG